MWTETISNVAAGHADVITITIGGPVFTGTRATSDPGIIVVFTVSRTDAAGKDLFFHVFTSKAGECSVTMQQTSSGVSGTFDCAAITDEDGHTVQARGSFAT